MFNVYCFACILSIAVHVPYLIAGELRSLYRPVLVRVPVGSPMYNSNTYEREIIIIHLKLSLVYRICWSTVRLLLYYFYSSNPCFLLALASYAYLVAASTTTTHARTHELRTVTTGTQHAITAMTSSDSTVKELILEGILAHIVINHNE